MSDKSDVQKSQDDMIALRYKWLDRQKSSEARAAPRPPDGEPVPPPPGGEPAVD